MKDEQKKFLAVVFKAGECLRVSIYAVDALAARAALEAEYGYGNVFDVHNEIDAEKPR